MPSNERPFPGSPDQSVVEEAYEAEEQGAQEFKKFVVSQTGDGGRVYNFLFNYEKEDFVAAYGVDCYNQLKDLYKAWESPLKKSLGFNTED